MFRKSSRLIVLFLLIAAPAAGQVASRVDQPDYGSLFLKPLVTAAVSRDQVRMTALALTQQIRLEVLSQAGELVYDSGLRTGNRLEWAINDQQGLELRDGIYGCIVTLENLNGQASHRRGIFKVSGGIVSFDLTTREAPSVSDEQENLIILRAEEPSPFTLVSHDGKEGWIESGSGGLSFYAGSLSRRRDSVPQLRLTPEGNLGIGVAEPEAKLDVAGLIRASEGFQFSDGTVLKMEGGNAVLVTNTLPGAVSNGIVALGQVSSTSTFGHTGSENARLLAATGGTARVYATFGTSGKIAKFTSSTDLGDSALAESGGNIGVGTTVPGVKLDVIGGMRIYPANENEAGLVLSNQIAPSVWQFATYNSGKFYIQEAGVGPRMVMVPGTGSVGIGTPSPTSKLTVAGNVEVTGTGNGILFSDGSTLTSSVAARIRTITYLAGCDSCGVLTDADDQRTIFFNLTGAMTINSVTCFSDTGTPTINLQRDSGSPVNILTSDLTCSTAGTTTTGIVGGQSVLNLNDKLDFVMVSAGGTAKRVTVAIKATVN